MKWIIKTILVISGIIPLSKCSSGYKEKNGKTTFNGKEITDKNFVILSDEFAKDSTTAYYKEHPFQYADIASFKAVDDHYAKDKNKVYYCDEYREGQNYYLTKRQTILEVKKADPASFISLHNGYGKDNFNAYFQGVAFNVKDVKSFKSIDPHFAKDDVSAYLNLRPIAGSAGKTFEIIDRNFAKDTAHIYYYSYTGEAQHNICILPCDKPSFEMLDYRYSKDKLKVFFLCFKIKDADAATFKILEEGYSKDQHAVYFESKRVAGVNPATFEVYKENGVYGHDVNYAKDNAAVYMDDKKLSNADVATFKVLGENYGSDGKHVFYKMTIMKDADPASFRVYPHDVGNADAEDAKNKFHEGIKVVEE
ncbi:MAG: DKNYY domain-containing protein [Ferruginibacter sp.]